MTTSSVVTPSIYNRAEIVDRNFIKWVTEGNLPLSLTSDHAATQEPLPLTPTELMDLFESQVMSRHLDLQARILKNQKHN